MTEYECRSDANCDWGSIWYPNSSHVDAWLELVRNRSQWQRSQSGLFLAIQWDLCINHIFVAQMAAEQIWTLSEYVIQLNCTKSIIICIWYVLLCIWKPSEKIRHVNELMLGESYGLLLLCDSMKGTCSFDMCQYCYVRICLHSSWRTYRFFTSRSGGDFRIRSILKTQPPATGSHIWEIYIYKHTYSEPGIGFLLLFVHIENTR